MAHRISHIVCSLWLVVTSLVPGQGWTLCVSPNGHVAVELAPAGLREALPDMAGSACREDCAEERCEACHDVSLASAERVVSRRDVAAVDSGPTPAAMAALHAPNAPDPSATVAPAGHDRAGSRTRLVLRL